MKYQKISKYKYRLAEGELRQTAIKGPYISTPFIHLWSAGSMWISKGYAWNGSNWSFDKHSKTASLFHDAAYQLMRMGLLGKEHRKYFDRLYRDMCIEKGLWKIHANLRYRMLRMFGFGGAKRSDKIENPVFEE